MCRVGVDWLENHNVFDTELDKYIEDKEQTICKHCGQTMLSTNTICNYCGKSIEEPIEQIGVEKDKWVTFLLIMFTGIFGGHKFYEGRRVQGCVYVSLTISIVGIIITLMLCFIDMCVVLTKKSKYYV